MFCTFQECGLHGGGDADAAPPMGWVWSHGSHLQDRHAAYQPGAARSRFGPLPRVSSADLRGDEAAAVRWRAAAAHLCTLTPPPTPPPQPGSFCPVPPVCLYEAAIDDSKVLFFSFSASCTLFPLRRRKRRSKRKPPPVTTLLSVVCLFVCTTPPPSPVAVLCTWREQQPQGGPPQSPVSPSLMSPRPQLTSDPRM